MTNLIRTFALVVLTLGPVSNAFAQSPNTAGVAVSVVDQINATIPDALVLISNETGTTREATTRMDGTATINALPIGVYSVQITKEGYASEGAQDLVLRAGETALLRVRLLPMGGTSEITVYGTEHGLRNDPEIGTRLTADQLEGIPLLGRKLSNVPLLDSSFRSAKGNGDLYTNATLFVSGAGGWRQTDFVVDGATGNEPWARQTMFATLPVGAVEEMNVMSKALSSEFGWTSGPAVNIVTKSGTNVMRGEGLILGRPGGAQPSTFGTGAQCPGSISSCVDPVNNGAAAELLPPNMPDSLLQGAFAIGGAITQNRTHYFIAGDFSSQNRTAPITTPLALPGTTFEGKFRQALVSARLDHKLSAAQSLMVRLNLDRLSDTNPEDVVSGNVLPSAGRRYSRHARGFQATDTFILSPRMVNEARVEYQNANPVSAFEPLTPSTQFTRLGAVPFTSGESRSAHVSSRVVQASDSFSWSLDEHDVRFGGSFTHSVAAGDNLEFGNAFVQGQYIVKSTSTALPDQLALADMQNYSQSFNLGVSSYETPQSLFSAWAQDSYRATNDVTVTAGIRYDRQTFADSNGNFTPRIGATWNFFGDPKTVIRGGYGFYYTQLRSSYAADFELGGPQGIFTYTATPGQAGFPTCLTCTPVTINVNTTKATLPARDISIRPGMSTFYSQFFTIAQLAKYSNATFENPRSQTGSIGVEREVMPRLIVSADYVKQHWTGLDRWTDLNAPSFFLRTKPGQVRTTTAANATRPIVPVAGGYRQIWVAENLGDADYDGMTLAARWQNAKMFASMSYTLSKATNTTEPDGPFIPGPNDFNELNQEERAPSALDQRHRAVFTVTHRLPYDLMIGTIAQFASARPLTAITGVDNNGDGLNNDRPVINGQVVGRNAFRGTGMSDVTLFGEGKLLHGQRTATLRLEVFNLFNHANVVGRNMVYGDAATPLPTFGLALPGLANIDPGRMVQAQLKYSF
jgi:hypothetical protein